jgi:hypothetical protein
MPQPNDKFWERASAALVRIATSRTRDRAKAKEHAQQAILEALPQWHEQEDLATFVSRASGLMRRNWFNERRMTKLRENESWLRTAANQAGGLRRTPEDLVAARERKARLLEQLLEQLKDDPVAREIVEQVLVGRDTPADQAEALGREIHEIRNAHKRLVRAVRAVAAAEGGVDVALGWDADQVSSDEEETEQEVKS